MADDALVLLCTCRDAGELQMLRAALEARGVPLRIEGATTHGMLGMIHGAGLAPRVMVPPQWRATAREIAAEIVGPFDDGGDDDAPRAIAATPFRAMTPDPDEPDGDAEPDDDDDDDDDDVATVAPARRSFAVPLMLAVLGLPWGFAHIYARRPVRGLALMVTAAIAAGWVLSGSMLGAYLLGTVALVDLVGSIALIARDNRATH
ncbi:MAG: DUF2007 domain-containing protein [Myxococcales bacterium]|nr:DUF2007 domain-containing protein [Myxococcales bacterium]